MISLRYCRFYCATVLSLLLRYEDVFRLSLGRDPPVDVAPLRVTLKAGAEPVQYKARCYSKELRDFMAKHVEELQAAWLCCYNHRSKWCSAPLIVKKPEANDFRMAVDVRPVNAQTERIIWPMPMLEVILDHLADEASQKMFSFLTDTGVYMLTRVLMGGTDSVAYCQSSVQEMFQDELYRSLLIWLDHLLGYDKSKEGLLASLERVLVMCESRGLKLNPKKCRSQARPQTHQGVARSEVAGDRARFTAIHMRHELDAHADSEVQPITHLLESVYKAAGGRSREKVAKAVLADMGQNAEHVACLTS
ncbi:hypothetical protein AaE_015135 [Aphanomyces astaci]|uniref:Reverse transcriptase domain-containing protein n=1 Tax=Aphanomyces astaci TaxID=112090 RepID=A0A6A4Z9U0_APHAT|nr:hypothetical protein AaE_015135 [Aphanomyces astaci]